MRNYQYYVFIKNGGKHSAFKAALEQCKNKTILY